MSRRAGRRTLRQVRRERWGVMRRLWRRYLVFAVMLASGAAVSARFMSPLLGAFFAGLYTAGFFALVAYSLMLDGSHLRVMGAEAERWTSQELGKLRGWRVIDAVQFADRDIDHLLVGDGGVFAVETKWTSRRLRIDARGVHGLWCDGVAQAAWAADRARRLLASRGVHADVVPVLVLWGRGVPTIPGGYQRVGEVRMLVGKQAPEWRTRLAALPLADPQSRTSIERSMRMCAASMTTHEAAAAIRSVGSAPVTPRRGLRPPGASRLDDGHRLGSRS